MTTSIIDTCPGTPIVLMKFGSHLYGTDTEESDTDYKGVFIPRFKDVALGKFPRSVNTSTGNSDSKNSSDDVDIEWFSLQKFVEMALQGQTGIIDMLFSPSDWPEYTTHHWAHLQERRSQFITSDMSAFVGYCRSQASKYGIKGSRLRAIQEVVDFLATQPEDAAIGDVLDASKFDADYVEVVRKSDKTFVEIAAKKIEYRTPVWKAREPLDQYLRSYGDRAKKARKNEGIDWKAVSHAFRVAYELEELYQTGDIKFPLAEAEFLTKVKKGAYDFNDFVAPRLENAIDRVYEASRSTNKANPDTSDIKDWCETLILNCTVQSLNDVN